MAKNDSFKVRAQELSHQTPEYLETLFAVGNGQIGVRAGHPLKVNELYGEIRAPLLTVFLIVSRFNTVNGHTAMPKSIRRSSSCRI